MTRPRVVKAEVVIQRKHDALPRFLVLPGQALDALDLNGTTVVEVSINNKEIGRRSLKRWGKSVNAWFIDLPNSICAHLELETDRKVEVVLRIASDALPTELNALLQRNSTAKRNWEKLTPSKKRALREHIVAAKRSDTRARRAKRALLNNG